MQTVGLSKWTWVLLLVLVLANALPAQGANLAFSSNRTGRFQVWTVQTEDPAGTLKQVTTAGAALQESRAPDWSRTIADGAPSFEKGRVAYQFGASGVRGIHLIKPDGSGDVRLTPPTSASYPCTDERDPSWSPSGRFIVYACLVSSGNYDLWVHDVGDTPDDPSDDRDFSLFATPFPGSLELRPAWSPDGKKIAYVTSASGQAHIAVVDVAYEFPPSIIAGSPKVVTSDASINNFDPTWSPDSTEIAFSSTRTGGRDIYKVRVDCPERKSGCPAATRLTTSTANDSNPAWSRDGQLIAFVTDREGNPEI